MSDLHNSMPKKTLGELMDAGAIDIATGFPCGDHNGDGNGVLQIRPYNVTIQANISLSEQKHVPVAAAQGKPTLLPGDIVFNNTNTLELVGKTALWDGPEGSVFSNHMTRIRVADPAIPPRYLAHAIHAHWLAGRSEMLARAHVAQASILGERFREIKIPWPALAEQRAFAATFDALAASFANERQALDAAQALKRAAMRELFTRGLRGEARKETEIGPIPESWEVVPLSELASMMSGGTPPKSDPALWQGDTPWVSGKDLKINRLRDVTDHITATAAANHSKIAPAQAVLVLVRGMGLAKGFPLSLIERPMAFNQDLKALVSRGRVSGAFLMHVLTACAGRMLGQLSDAAHGTKRLGQNDLDTFPVPVPTDPVEQTEIVAALDAIDCKIALHKEKRAVLEALFKSLLLKLMTGEVRVADLNLDALGRAAEAA